MKTITELKRDISISEVLDRVGDHHTETRFGQGWRAIRCPFHDDKNPSAGVNEIEGRFNCHACDVSGDILDIAMHHLGTDSVKEVKEWLESNFR